MDTGRYRCHKGIIMGLDILWMEEIFTVRAANFAPPRVLKDSRWCRVSCDCGILEGLLKGRD